MSMNLIHANATVTGKRAMNWRALTTISATDPTSPYPTEGYVTVSAETVVRLAALLDGAKLANGQRVITYNFSYDNDGHGHVEAHIESFGPSLLGVETIHNVRALLADFPVAIAMLNEVIARGLQISLSTETLSGKPAPHLKGVNWFADDVEFNRCSGNMLGMLRTLGLGRHIGDDEGRGEVPFDVFASAVESRADRTDHEGELLAFVACARRNAATYVYWA